MRDSKKLIVMFHGMGNNERGWARLVSRFGKVVLIRQGHFEQVEVWEGEQCTSRGPELRQTHRRFWQDITFGAPIIWRCIRCAWPFTRGATIDLVVGSNYAMGLAALLLRALGKTRKVVCLLTDYMPIRGSVALRSHRWISAALTRLVARRSDEVWTVSPRIPTATVNPCRFEVPICLDDNQAAAGPRNEIGYIGFPSPDHALEELFDICRRHALRLNVIGDSAYLQSIRHMAPPGAVFHGILSDEARVHEIMARCFCGYAVYRNTGPENYSYYGIPSKTFYCFASDTPVVTTDTADFTRKIEAYAVGRVIKPVPEQIEQAILQLKKDYPAYADAIRRFRAEWNAATLEFHRERLAQLL